MSTVSLLGPQRHAPTLVEAVEEAGVAGAVAVVTAGWQEREEEVDELAEHLGRRVVNLRLHARAEEVFAADRELFRAWRERQDRLRQLQQVYRLRLGFATEAARELMRRRTGTSLLEPDREDAIDGIRRLDARHLARLEEVHRDFEERWRLPERETVARQRAEVAAAVADCEGLGIAGGHVAVLVNRLRLFAVGEALGGRPLFAWSGGAMVTAEMVVLFHDRPPQGGSQAEVLESGLALHRGLLPLPHARRRLDLEDPARVELFARRFRDTRCLALDDGARVTWDGRSWRAGPGIHRLGLDGSLEEGIGR